MSTGPQESVEPMKSAESELMLPHSFSSSISHQILTLVGSAFLCFEFVFLCLYFDPGWFALDLSLLGTPVLMVCLLLAHLLLCFGESNLACSLFSPIGKGAPPILYRKWIRIEKGGIRLGRKHVRFEAIDEIELSWFGNLIVKSNLICGEDTPEPDHVLKFQFAAASFSNQEILLDLLKQKRPNLILSKRLKLGRNPALQKGTLATQLITAGIMSLVLLDLGFSSFYFLELLKNYYLAETDLLSNQRYEATKHFKRAEYLRLHPLAFSWVTGKFLHNSSVSSGIWEQRSRILWLEGEHDQAIQNSKKAVEETPNNLRHRLFLVRLLEEENRSKEAREELEQALEEHKHALLPQIYLLAITKARNPQMLEKEYKKQLDYCFEETFKNEPNWPPGGNRHFIELFYSDDIIFLLDRMLGSKYKLPPFHNEVKKNKE